MMVGRVCVLVSILDWHSRDPRLIPGCARPFFVLNYFRFTFHFEMLTLSTQNILACICREVLLIDWLVHMCSRFYIIGNMIHKLPWTYLSYILLVLYIIAYPHFKLNIKLIIPWIHPAVYDRIIHGIAHRHQIEDHVYLLNVSKGPHCWMMIDQ